MDDVRVYPYTLVFREGQAGERCHVCQDLFKKNASGLVLVWVCPYETICPRCHNTLRAWYDYNTNSSFI